MVEYLRSLRPIILVRHGQSPSNVEPMVGDWQNYGLTEVGQKQAIMLAKRLEILLKGKQVALYSSHLKRAFETAKKIDEKLNCGIIVEEDLEEYKTNLDTGISRPDAEKYKLEKPEPSKKWRTFQNSESLEDLYYRAGKVLNHIMDKKSDVTIIVSHGWMIDRMISWWLNISVDDIRPNMFPTANASISVLSISEYGDRVLLKLNDTSHLNELNNQPSFLY